MRPAVALEASQRVLKLEVEVAERPPVPLLLVTEQLWQKQLRKHKPRKTDAVCDSQHTCLAKMWVIAGIAQSIL